MEELNWMGEEYLTEWRRKHLAIKCSESLLIILPEFNKLKSFSETYLAVLCEAASSSFRYLSILHAIEIIILEIETEKTNEYSVDSWRVDLFYYSKNTKTSDALGSNCECNEDNFAEAVLDGSR